MRWKSNQGRQKAEQKKGAHSGKKEGKGGTGKL